MISKRVLIVIFLLLPAFDVDASLTLTLGSNTDLSNLQVDDVFTIDVALSGLGSSELTSLGGSVLFSETFLGSPQNSTAGPIVPDPLDIFFNELPGIEDAMFFAFTGNIASEGVFFSFDLTAAAVGSGTISFDPSSLFAEDDQFSPIYGIETNSLSFIIKGTSQEVPEPASITAWVLLFMAVGICKLKGLFP